jgi:bifunctional DNA-binding transcriptional regulator/antitoxin component of YhaV-PrlF toxin-antitoxin module
VIDLSEVELTHMTSKGQVVIPFDIRKEINVGVGTVFAVFGSGDTIMLKKVHKPTKEELKKSWIRLVEEGSKKAKRLGIEEKDVAKLIHRGRGVKDA